MQQNPTIHQSLSLCHPFNCVMSAELAQRTIRDKVSDLYFKLLKKKQ